MPISKSPGSRCNIILGDPSMVSEVLGTSQQLEWVQSSWAGVDHLCQEGHAPGLCTDRCKGIFGPLISEYVMTYLFAFERRCSAMRRNQLKQHWRPLPYRPAKEITAWNHRSGFNWPALGATARHFGMQVTGLNRSGRPCDDVEKVYTAENLQRFLETLDYVVLTLPATPQTKHFIMPMCSA